MTFKLPNISVGTKFDNAIKDSAGDDWLFGLSGDDVFDIAGGRDYVSGGRGNDTAVFHGKFSSFKVCDTLFGLATTVTGKGVCTTLSSVETLVFDNGTYDNCTNKFTANTVSLAGGGTVTEGGALVFTFARTGDLSRAYDATFTLDGSANASDFGLSALPTKVTFAAGSSTATLVLKSVDDFTYEGTETLKLNLTTDGCRYELGSASSALGTVLDAQASLPNCPTVMRAGTVDGSSSADQVLTGIEGANTFFFSVLADSGHDRITNFGKHDVLVTDVKLLDSNRNGLVDFGLNGVLDLDSGNKAGGDDQAAFEGYPSQPGLRFLGEACDGLYVYADGQVRPAGATEGTLRNDMLTGDAVDARKQVFFFDTALELGLGNDQIRNFGAKDLLVTTTKVADVNTNGIVDFGTNGVLDLSGGGGTVAVKGLTALEFDGQVNHDGVDYFVYSQVGSVAGTADLLFA